MNDLIVPLIAVALLALLGMKHVEKNHPEWALVAGVTFLLCCGSLLAVLIHAISQQR